MTDRVSGLPLQASHKVPTLFSVGKTGTVVSTVISGEKI